MQDEIEEDIRKNIIIYLSHHGCNTCFKPYSDQTIVELDDLTYIFAEKLFYKLDCTVANNISSIKKNYKYYTEKHARMTFSLLKPFLHGNILRFGITCIYCWNTKYLEFHLSKYDSTKNYIK